MTALGVFALLLGLLTAKFGVTSPTRTKVTIFALAYLFHLVATVIFYLYAQENSSDSRGYYLDPLDFYAGGFGVGTQFLIYIVQTIKLTIGGTFFDHFLLFQSIGMLGIMILMRIMDEVYAELGVEQPLHMYLLLFLPGLHFWTSAIGKDGPLFCAVCLAIWAAMRWRRRIIAFAVAMLIMLMIRPHIALIALIALAISILVDQATALRFRILLGFLAIAGVVVAVVTVQTTFGLNLANPDSVFLFVEALGNMAESESAGNTVVTGSYPVKLFSLLFRPLFFDAQGAFAYVASLENFAFMLIVGYLVLRFRSVVRLLRTVFFLRFAFVFAIGVALLLAAVYYNVGLGLRQRTMVLPGFLVLFVALQALRAARRQTLTVEVRPVAA